MLHSSTEHYGYLLWLDFTRVEDKDVNLLSRPRILPYIPPDSVKSDDPRCKKLVEAAKTIASVASSMVYDWKHNLIDKDRNSNRSIVESTSDFQRKVLHVSEKNWYEQRDTWEKVIDTRKYIYWNMSILADTISFYSIIYYFLYFSCFSS
jgi:hypothetical protein